MPPSPRHLATGVHKRPGHQQPQPAQQAKCCWHYPHNGAVDLSLLGIIRKVAYVDIASYIGLGSVADRRRELHRAPVNCGELHHGLVGGGGEAVSVRTAAFFRADHGALGHYTVPEQPTSA